MTRGTRAPGVGRRRLLGIGGGVLTAAWLAACGGDSDNDGSGSGGSGGAGNQAGTSSTTVAGGTPKPGGSLTTRINGNASLDLITAASYRAATVQSWFASRLLKVHSDSNANTANNLEFVPDLAAALPEIPGDGLTYVWKLRPNAKFHNIAPVDGRTVTSEDVAATIERFRSEPRNNSRTNFVPPQADIERFETPDPQTVVMKLARPYAPFLSLFANSYYIYIQPKEATTGGYDPSKTAIGSGPFVLESYQPDIAYKFKKNPDYFLPGQPYVDTAELVIMVEDQQEMAQLQAGKFDISTTVPGFPAEAVPEFRRSNPKATIIEYLDGLHDQITMQLRGESPFRDERIRRALSMAIDRQALLDLRFGGKGVWQSAVPAWHARFWLDPQSDEAGPAAQYVKFNPKESRALLKAAGAEGLRFNWIYSPNAGYGERFNQAAEAIAGMLKEAGFEPTVTISDYQSQYIVNGGVTSGNFQGAYIGLNSRSTEPHEYIFPALHSKSIRNSAGTNDPQLDALIDAEVAELDLTKRVALIKDLQRYVMDKAYRVYTVVGNGYAVIHPWVHNYYRNAGYGQGSEMAIHVWMDKQ